MQRASSSLHIDKTVTSLQITGGRDITTTQVPTLQIPDLWVQGGELVEKSMAVRGNIIVGGIVLGNLCGDVYTSHIFTKDLQTPIEMYGNIVVDPNFTLTSNIQANVITVNSLAPVAPNDMIVLNGNIDVPDPHYLFVSHIAGHSPITFYDDIIATKNVTVDGEIVLGFDGSAVPLTNDVLTFDGTNWRPTAIGNIGGGSVFQVNTGAGLIGGPITVSGTISIDTAGVTNAMLAGGITNAKLQNSDVTVTAGTGLSGGGLIALGGSTILSLPNVGSPSTYGSASQVPVLTTDAQGRVSSVTNTTISIGNSNLANSSLTVTAGTGLSGGGVVALGGSTTLSMPNVGSPAIYGSASQVPVLTTDAQGRVSNVTNTTISIGNSNLANSSLTVTAGTGLSGGGVVALGGSTTLSLPNVGTSSTYGSASEVPVLTTDSQGRVSSVTNTTISIGNSNLANSSLTVTAGTGLSGGGVVALGGTTTLSLPSVGAPATYGSASQVPVLTTDTQGRVSGVTNTNISIGNSNLANSSLTVTAGSGLTGGGTVSLGGTTTLSIPAAGVSNTMLANPSLTVTAGSGLSGGGAVALGGSTSLSIPASGVSNTMLANSSLTVTAGSGLSGGGAVALGASTTLSIPSAGVTNTMLANPSLTVTAGTGMSGGGSVALGGSVTLDNAGVTSFATTLSGLTTNMSTGAVSLGGTLNVAAGGTGGTTFTTGGVIYGNGTSAIGASAAGTSGQLLISGGAGSPTWSSTPTVTSLTITEDPITNSMHAVTKAYVDAAVAGLNVHDAVYVATTSATELNAGGVPVYNNGMSGVGATLTAFSNNMALTIDGYTFTATDVTNATRILVKNQADQTTNGIYVFSQVEAAMAKWVITRAADADNSPPGEFIQGDFNFVQAGTVNASTGWVETCVGTGGGGQIVIGTDNVCYTQISGAGTYSAGAGLDLVGTTFSVGTGEVTNAMLTNSSVTVSAGSGLTGGGTISLGGSTTLSIPSAGVTNSMLANSSLTVTAGSGLSGGGAVALGGSTTLSIPSAGVTNTMLANPSLTVTAGTGLTGGGTVALGGTTTINMANTSLTVTAGSGLSGGGSVSLGGSTSLAIATGGVTNAMLTNDSVTVTAGTGLSGGGTVALGGSITLNNTGVTSVATGSGLTGGPITTTGTIAVATGGVTNAMLQNSSITVSAGSGLSGGGSVSLGGTVSLANAGVTSATGTANQVNVSASTGAVTFSLPQDIATTSSPTFVNETLTNTLLYTNGIEIGNSSTTTGASNSIAIGKSANASTSTAIMIGTSAGSASATGTNTLGIGTSTQTVGCTFDATITTNVILTLTSNAVGTFAVGMTLTSPALYAGKVIRSWNYGTLGQSGSVYTIDLSNNTASVNFTAVNAGSNNVSMGASSLQYNTGGNNVALGTSAGGTLVNNVGVTGSNNTLVGTNTNAAISSNTVAVGYNAVADSIYSTTEIGATNSSGNYTSGAYQTFLVSTTMVLYTIQWRSAGTTVFPLTAELRSGALTMAGPGALTLINSTSFPSAPFSGNWYTVDYSSLNITLTPGSYTFGVPSGQNISWSITTSLDPSYPAYFSGGLSSDRTFLMRATSNVDSAVVIGPNALSLCNNAIALGTGITANQIDGFFVRHRNNVTPTAARVAVYNNATNELVGLPYAGGSGYVLTSDAAGAVAWAAAGASGTAGGVLSGTYPNPDFAEITLTAAKTQIGFTSTAVDDSIAIGPAAVAGDAESVVIGSNASANGLRSTVVGYLNLANSTVQCSIFGARCYSDSDAATLLGYNTAANTSDRATCIGRAAFAQTSNDSVVIGTGASANSAAGAVVIGQNIPGNVAGGFFVKHRNNVTPSAARVAVYDNTSSELVGLPYAGGSGYVLTSDSAGAVAWTAPATGTVTSVATGAGLTGGPITTTGTIAIATGGVTNAMLANSSITVTAGTGMSGGGTAALGGTVTLTNAGVTSATGTANQVNVSASTGAVTFSLPQDIATSSSPSFVNLSLTGSGANGQLRYTNGVEIGNSSSATFDSTGIVVGKTSSANSPNAIAIGGSVTAGSSAPASVQATTTTAGSIASYWTGTEAQYQSIIVSSTFVLGSIGIYTGTITSGTITWEIYSGVLTSGSLSGLTFLGSVNITSTSIPYYTVDFSSLGLTLTPGTYTVGMPFGSATRSWGSTMTGVTSPGQPAWDAFVAFPFNVTFHLDLINVPPAGNNSIAIGQGATTIANNAIALGQGITAVQPNGFYVKHRGPIVATVNPAGFIAGTNELIEVTSSRRFKDNIRDLESVSEKLDKFRPVRYNAKPNLGGDKREHIGLIAEEVEELFPEFVTYDSEGQVTGMMFDRVVSVLIKEIQEMRQREKITAQRLEALEKTQKF